MTIRKIVEVEWVDSTRCITSWRVPEDDDFIPVKCVTAGYLLKKTKKTVTICLSQERGARNVVDAITIPRQCVTRFEILKEEKVPR